MIGFDGMPEMKVLPMCSTATTWVARDGCQSLKPGVLQLAKTVTYCHHTVGAKDGTGLVR